MYETFCLIAGAKVRSESNSEEVALKNTSDDEIAAALSGIRSRLDTLASITAENILIPGEPQKRYHHIIEEAYVALGLIETQVDELRAELEYQHQRLDEARDAPLPQVTLEQNGQDGDK